MKRIGFLIALAFVGFACADSVGQMLEDAGQMMQDGSVPDAGAQDEMVTCNKSEKVDLGNGVSITYRWAEFDVDPGATEVTGCYRYPDTPDPLLRQATCSRNKATWFQGTSNGFFRCGRRTNNNGTITDNPDPVSITVHR